MVLYDLHTHPILPAKNVHTNLLIGYRNRDTVINDKIRLNICEDIACQRVLHMAVYCSQPRIKQTDIQISNRFTVNRDQSVVKPRKHI